jgi:hypothetical protein
MSSDKPSDYLARAARRAARGPAQLIASQIEAWRKAFPDQSPEESLACSARIVGELALCRRPRDEQWVEDATEIAGALALNADHLIAFLRKAEAVQQFGDAHPADAYQEGALLAARDRDEKE